MKVLITGANGQLGTDLADLCEQRGDAVTRASHAELDVTDRDGTHEVIRSSAPEVVVHAGAWTNVDGCEADPRRAYEVNALGSRFVAEAAAAVNARVVYVSSDYVFDGTGGPGTGGPGALGPVPYSEWDEPGPASHYGRSKLGGEREIVSVLGRDAAIVRASWVVGRHGHNFVKTMLRLAHDPAMSPTVVDDQIGCPTFTADLAEILREVAVRRVAGVFHTGNAEPVSWCAFAKAIFAAAGHDPERVRPTTSAAYAAGRTAVTAPRPAYSVLGSVALTSLGIAVPNWRPALADTVRALNISG